MTAVITDVHYRMAPALIRDLARAGVRVVCCERANVPGPLGFRSKYCAQAVTLPAEGWREALYALCAEQARREGEGDRSLLYWQQVHERFFREEMAASGLIFTEDMPVVCEEFHMVWPE